MSTLKNTGLLHDDVMPMVPSFNNLFDVRYGIKVNSNEEKNRFFFFWNLYITLFVVRKEMIFRVFTINADTFIIYIGL